MKHKLFFIIFLLLAAVGDAYGADDSKNLEINLEQPGTIYSLYWHDLTNPEYTSVSVAGTINQEDIAALNAASRKYALRELNLENATIVEDKLPDDAFSTYVDAPNSPQCQLTKIILPDNLSEIGDYAFENLAQLKSLKIPAALRKIGAYAFAGCTSLQSISLPEGLTELGMGCFKNCTSLKDVELPSSLLRINPYAFEGAGIEEIYLPEGITTLNRYAFKSASLKSIALPESCTEYNANVFDSNKQLRDIKLPQSMTIVPYGIFNNCTALQKIDLHEGIETVHSRAFNNCTSLTEINMPSTLLIVYTKAFYNFGGETVIFPENLIMMGCCAFLGSKPLKSIYSKNINAPGLNCDPFIGGGRSNSDYEVIGLYAPDPNIPVYIPRGSYYNYYSWQLWNYFNNFIEVDEFPSSGIDNPVTTDDEVKIYGNISGCLTLEGAEGIYEIYSTNGQKVNSGYCSGNLNISISSGLYLVRIGNTVKKVIVK